MTKSRMTECEKEKNQKNLEIIDHLNDENNKIGKNEEVTKKGNLKLRIVFVREKVK